MTESSFRSDFFLLCLRNVFWLTILYKYHDYNWLVIIFEKKRKHYWIVKEPYLFIIHNWCKQGTWRKGQFGNIMIVHSIDKLSTRVNVIPVRRMTTSMMSCLWQGRNELYIICMQAHTAEIWIEIIFYLFWRKL